MKRLILIAAALSGAAVFAWVGPAHGQAAGGTPAAPTEERRHEIMAGIDQATTQIRGVTDWMNQSQVRAELRDLGQILGRACEQLGGTAQRMAALADSREFKSSRAEQREIDRFQSRLAVMARELAEAGGALRLMAEREGKAGDPCPQAEQTDVGAEQRDLERRAEQLKRHIDDLNAWMVMKGARSELQETSRDMVQLRERLATLLQGMILLRQEGRTDSVWVRSMDRFLDRLQVMTREMMEAHESLTQLANAT